MSLGEKVRYLREVEGSLRGLGRGMTQLEVVHAVQEELGSSLSQAYLSQVENGRRKHLTDESRMLLARFFKVHPGYLVSDPEGFSIELLSETRAPEDALHLWLIRGAEEFEQDPDIREALLAIAKYPDSRQCLTLIHSILQEPGLADRLLQALDSKQP